jgi:hypothetical protein
VFPMFMICQDNTERTTKSIHIQKNTFHSIYDFSRSHRARGKEHTSTGKSSNLETKNKKTEILSL